MINLKMYAILGGTIVLLGLALGFMWDTLQRVKTERDQAVEFNNATQDSLRYFKNGWGRETARSAVLDLTLRNAQRLQSDERLAWVRQFESVNKRMNNLESATRTVAQAVGSFTMPLKDTSLILSGWLNDSTWLALGDTADRAPTPARVFDNTNEWIRVRGIITDDTVTVRVNTKVPIESVVVFERKKVLGLKIGRKQWFQETASPNPYVRITESTVIRVSKRKKR